MENKIKDKIKGCFYGAVVGDALGTTYEFKKAKNIILPKKLNIIGKGPFKVKKGQITDDSEMAIALIKSIIKNKKYDKEDVAKAYIRWIKSNPADIGITTSHALYNAENYKDVINNAKKYNKNSLSNGFIMKISPIAIYGIKLTKKELNKIIKEEVSMTHSNEYVFLIAKLYVYTLIYIMEGGKDIENYALKIVKNNKELISLIKMSKTTPYYQHWNHDKIIDIDGPKMGFVFVSLQIAFYEIFNAKNYESAMRDIISFGGDTDTNCAIAGAMLGSYFGYENIPKRWIDCILEAKYDRPEEFKLDKDLVKNLEDW